MSTDFERLSEVIDFLKSARFIHNARDFAEIVGSPVSFISEAKNGKRTITKGFVEKIELKFPQISGEYILTGSGDMLKREMPPSPELHLPRLDGELVAYDDESYQSALSKYDGRLVPEYSAEFRGGQNGAILSDEHLVAHWFIPNAPRGAFLITMVGQSMMPDIRSGSRLLLSPANFDRDYPTSIPFGNIFGVVIRHEDSNEYSAHIKILRRHTERNLERSHWIARSINREHYDDFDIPIDQVTHLYKVVACINNLWSF